MRSLEIILKGLNAFGDFSKRRFGLECPPTNLVEPKLPQS